jgi:hypothetical protein
MGALRATLAATLPLVTEAAVARELRGCLSDLDQVGKAPNELRYLSPIFFELSFSYPCNPL